MRTTSIGGDWRSRNTALKLQVVRRFRLPQRFADLGIEAGRLTRHVTLFREHGMLWLLQMGFGVRLFRMEKDLLANFDKIRRLVGTMESCLSYFHIPPATQREIIFKALAKLGKPSGHADELERFRTIYEVAEFRVTPPARAQLVEDLLAPAEGNYLLRARQRLMTRVATERPEKLQDVYRALNLSERKTEVLPRLNDQSTAGYLITMNEEEFERRYQVYCNGMDITYRDARRVRQTERFTFSDKEGMLDVVLRFPLETIRQRLMALRVSGYVVITASRLAIGKTEGGLAENYALAGNQALLRGDLLQAERYFREAILHANRQQARLVEIGATRCLESTQCMQRATVAEERGEWKVAIAEYEAASRALGPAPCHPKIAAYIRDRALALYGGLSVPDAREELRRAVAYKPFSSEHLLTAWMLSGKVPQLETEVPAEVIAVARNISEHFPLFSVVRGEIMFDLVLKAHAFLQTYAREPDSQMATAVVLHCLLQKPFRLSGYPGLVEYANHVLRDLYHRGTLPFSPDALPTSLRGILDPIYLCFAVSLFVASERPITAWEVSHHGVRASIERLAEFRYRQVRRRLYLRTLTSILEARGILAQPTYLQERYALGTLLRRVLLYEAEGIPFSADYWWQLNTPDTAINDHHIPLIQRRRAKGEWIAEKLPRAPNYIRFSLGLEKMKAMMVIADRLGVKFLLEAGYFFTLMNQSAQAAERDLQKVAQRVELMIKILGLYGLDKSECVALLTSSYRELQGARLLTLARMHQLITSAGLEPAAYRERLIETLRSQHPITTFRLERLVAGSAAGQKEIGVIVSKDREDIVDLKGLEEAAEDVAEVWFREMRRFPRLSRFELDDLARRAKGRDGEARRMLLESSLLLVPYTLRRYSRYGPRHPQYADLLEEGNVALVQALETYSTTTSFAGHAIRCIRDAVKEALPRLRDTHGVSEIVKKLLGLE